MKQEIVTARNSTVTTGNTAYRLIAQMQQIIDTEIAKVQPPEVLRYDIWNNSVPDRAVRALRLRVFGHARGLSFSETFMDAFGTIMVESENIMNLAVSNGILSSHNCYRIMYRKGMVTTGLDFTKTELHEISYKTAGTWQITIYYLSGTKSRS